MASTVGRVIVRQRVNYGTTGTKEFDVVAPEGYRVLSGDVSIDEDEDGNYGDVDMMGSYIKVDVNGDLFSDTWRFQLKLNATCAVTFSVICERSDEPDILIVPPVVYV